MITRLGILHPGEMGSCLAETAMNTLGRVYWCSEGRSQASRTRAMQTGLTEVSTLSEFAALCQIIISVCPPAAAQAQAEQMQAHHYQGIYVDANAIAPQTAISIGRFCEAGGMQFVDGGIIGVPTRKPGTTWLYLSGDKAVQVQECFARGPFETCVLGAAPGQASALKICYAAWNKGKTALLTSVLAAAQSMQVRQALEQHWQQTEPGFVEAAEKRICQVARKAWRFTAEMEEIAATLEQCQVPGDFFVGAAEVYRRQASYKDLSQAPELDALLELLTRPE